MYCFGIYATITDAENKSAGNLSVIPQPRQAANPQAVAETAMNKPITTASAMGISHGGIITGYTEQEAR